MVENQKLDSKNLEVKLQKIDLTCGKLEAQIKNYDDQLIHKITAKDDIRKILNTVFSQEFAALPSKLVKKKITKAGTTLSIFDGEITLPKDLVLADIPSVKSLKEELQELKREKTELEKLWAVALNFDKAQKELDAIHADIEEVKAKLNKLKNKPKLEKEADAAGKELRTMKAEKEKCEGDLSKLKKELSDKTLLLDSLREETRRSEERIIELKRRKAEIETFGIVPTEFDTTESLDEIYGKIKISNNFRA